MLAESSSSVDDVASETANEGMESYHKVTLLKSVNSVSAGRGRRGLRVARGMHTGAGRGLHARTRWRGERRLLYETEGRESAAGKASARTEGGRSGPGRRNPAGVSSARLSSAVALKSDSRRQ